MIIYTSHYFKNYDKEKYYTVQISEATLPNKKPDKELKILYPPDDLRLKYKSGTIKKEEFLKKYKEFLDNIDVEKLKISIKEIIENANNNNKQVLLLCWEQDKNTCHRCIISEFVQKNLDIICMELE